jgi:acyl-CoA thioesterase YciA
MELITSTICKTKDLGVHGNMFGGILLSLLDESGAIFCAKIADTGKVVTLKLEEVVFKEPIKAGEILMIYGELLEIGNTSMTIQLEARIHDPENGNQFIACTTRMVFVKIDSRGRPSPISKKVKNHYSDKLRKKKTEKNELTITNN